MCEEKVRTLEAKCDALQRKHVDHDRKLNHMDKEWEHIPQAPPTKTENRTKNRRTTTQDKESESEESDVEIPAMFRSVGSGSSLPGP